MFPTKLSLVYEITILSSARRSAWLPWLTKQIICHWFEAPQKGLRPLNKSVWRGESESAWSSDVRTLFGKLFWKKRSKWLLQNWTKQIWIFLVESFPMVVSELSWPFWFAGKLTFCWLILCAQSSCSKNGFVESNFLLGNSSSLRVTVTGHHSTFYIVFFSF